MTDDEVKWLMKRIPKETRSKKPTKKKKSKVWKVKPNEYLPKTPEPTKEEKKKMETLSMIQSQLKEDKESKVEKEQREQELQNEINELSQREQADYNELVALEKQIKKAELEIAKFYKEQAKLSLENEILMNIQHKQRFKQYVKDMEKAGVTVDVNPDYLKKVKKDGK